MFDLFKEILRSPAGSFGSIIALFGLAFWLTHYVTRKVTEITSEHGILNKNVSGIEHHVDDIRKDLAYLKGTVDTFRLSSIPLIQSHSPISLTDRGREIAVELQAENIVARNWAKIFNDLEQNIKDKNAYDVQVYCMETAAVQPEKFFDKSALDAIKEVAYKQGNPFQYYSGVFGVLIRDKYLSLKGIDKAEIDSNDPNKKTT